jgi:hypothetical protein
MTGGSPDPEEGPSMDSKRLDGSVALVLVTFRARLS